MFKRILIPTDGSPLATKAAKAGIALASSLGAKVIGCYIVEELRPVFGPRLGVNQQMINEFNQRARDAGQEYLDKIGKMAERLAVPFTSAVVQGYAPQEGIAHIAKQHKCDAIFMSTHGRSGFSKIMMGSVTQKVLMHSTVPVVVYR